MVSAEQLQICATRRDATLLPAAIANNLSA
jgi:hypothetical protein